VSTEPWAVQHADWEVEAPSDGTMFFEAEDGSGEKLRFAYFPGREPPSELPDDFFGD
jgi:hypothetical protein